MAREGLIDCPCCEGSGEIASGSEFVYEAGCGFSHTEPVLRSCPDCEGTGQIMAPDEMGGNEDWTMQEALEADGEKLRQMTGEDHGPEFFETEQDQINRQATEQAKGFGQFLNKLMS